MERNARRRVLFRFTVWRDKVHHHSEAKTYSHLGEVDPKQDWILKSQVPSHSDTLPPGRCHLPHLHNLPKQPAAGEECFKPYHEIKGPKIIITFLAYENQNST